MRNVRLCLISAAVLAVLAANAADAQTGGGPLLTLLGLARADDVPLAPTGFDRDGRPIYSALFGSGITIVVEARAGSSGRPPARSAFFPEGSPDLQVLVSRPLGNGSALVCDRLDGRISGGVPAVPSLIFGTEPAILDAINDLGCRFNDGTGFAAGRVCTDACTRKPSGEFGCVQPDSIVQFCAPVAHSWAFPVGDTVVAARLRDTAGNFGPIAQMVVRVSASPPPTETPTPLPQDASPTPTGTAARPTASATRFATLPPTPTPTGGAPDAPTPTPTTGVPRPRAAQIVSRSAAAGERLLQVPADHTFLLTQFCSDDLRSFELAIGGVGEIPAPCCNTDLACITYEPGIAVPPGAAIDCVSSGTFGFGTRCVITGLLGRSSLATRMRVP